MDASSIRLSAIIPVHNKAATLPMVLDWVAPQLAVSDLHELIFVLDHSCDESAELLRHASGHPDFRVIENVDGPLGAGRSRNLGIQASTGTHCLFLDADIIGPDDFAARLRSLLACRPRGVVLGEVLGNAISTQIWPLLVRDHTARGRLGRAELLRWAADDAALADLRVSLLDKESGTFDHLPAPWTLGWSSAMAVSHALLLEVGGYDEDLEKKGSEDLDLSFRLFRRSATFSMLQSAPVLHLPHPRDRFNEEQQDRKHELTMLRMHSTPEMEALCAFDGMHANPMLDILSAIDEPLVRAIEALPIAVEQMHALGLPQCVPLIIGTSSSPFLELLRPKSVVCPHPPNSSNRLPLFGFRLPFDDRCFPSALITGIWQCLPERLACRIFSEVQRVADTVYLLKDARLPLQDLSWPAELLAAHDEPYWERSSRVSRSFYDYVPLLQGEVPPLYSFMLARLNQDQDRARTVTM